MRRMVEEKGEGRILSTTLFIHPLQAMNGL
jgi:hypothetical protein